MKLIIKNISYDKASIMRKKLDIISIALNAKDPCPRITKVSRVFKDKASKHIQELKLLVLDIP